MDLITRVDTLVETILLPESRVDTSSSLPESHLDYLLQSGLVTIVCGSSKLWNTASRFAITEQIAFGCLDTWFVITQHWGASGIVQRSNVDLRSFWDFNRLLGVGFGHLRRGVPCLTADLQGRDLLVDGKAPWVTGSSWLSWVVYGATLPDTRHIYFRLPHEYGDGYEIHEPQHLVAVRRTDTVEVRINLRIANDYILDIRNATDLSSQDEVTLVTSTAPILGLIARCLFDWRSEIKIDNLDVYQTLLEKFHEIRADVYRAVEHLESVAIPDRLELRQRLHALLEATVHLWSLTSGGQSNSMGMVVVRRRQEAAFFRVFQQTKILKKAAIEQALTPFFVKS